MKFTEREVLTMLICGAWIIVCCWAFGPAGWAILNCKLHHGLLGCSSTAPSRMNKPLDPNCPCCADTSKRMERISKHEFNSSSPIDCTWREDTKQFFDYPGFRCELEWALLSSPTLVELYMPFVWIANGTTGRHFISLLIWSVQIIGFGFLFRNAVRGREMKGEYIGVAT